MLGTPVDVGLDAGRSQFVPELLHDVLDVLFAIEATLV